MNTATATANFTRTDLASDTKSPPEWVELFPAGPELLARDGRRWTANAPAVLAAFDANRAPLPIDYEHAQDIKADKGDEAPAAGWIVALEARAGAVWGKVEWTARAASMIVEREYRFLSPAFTHTTDGLITRLLGAGLVNRPALELTALSRETFNQEYNMKAIAKALGLDEGVAEPAILAAIDADKAGRTAIASALKVAATADSAAILTAITKLQSDLDAATIALAGAPDQAALASLQTQLTDTTTALAALQKKDADREIDGALDAAQAAGKITPASRDGYRAMCAFDGGLERFKALAATLPVIAEPTKLGEAAATVDDPANIDPVALAARARKYQEDQLAAGREVDIATAVLEVKELKQ